MARVLIVVSSFYPVIIADMQRARMLAWELPNYGWEVEVLTPQAAEIRQDVVEPNGRAFFPPRLQVHEVGSHLRWLFNGLGSTSHAWRTYLPLCRAGDALLKSKRFDLVFFTTTTWLYFTLGPRWRRKFGIPYVLDFHDPWVKEEFLVKSSQRSLKMRFEKALWARLERYSVISASGLVSVSPVYRNSLRHRYWQWQPDWFQEKCSAVIPFAALENDLHEARQVNTDANANTDSLTHIIYVGAGGKIMARAFTVICQSLASLRRLGHPLVKRVRIELGGTMYRWQNGDAKHLENIALAEGVGDLVTESPERVSYRNSLELLLKSSGVLILGVEDKGYMPSKLFGYAITGKPLLAALHRDSPAYELFCKKPELGHVLWFDDQTQIDEDKATREIATFLEEAAHRRQFDRSETLAPFLAPAMAQQHAELFAACLGRIN